MERLQKIWDEISPGWWKGPPSRGLSVLWKSLFNLFLPVLHKYTATTHSLCLFFSLYPFHFQTDLFDVCNFDWRIQLVVSYLINVHIHLWFIVWLRVLYLCIFVMHSGQFKRTHTTCSQLIPAFVRCGMQPQNVFLWTRTATQHELIDSYSKSAALHSSSVFPLSCLVCPYSSLACSTKLSLQLTFLSPSFTSEVIQSAKVVHLRMQIKKYGSWGRTKSNPFSRSVL